MNSLRGRFSNKHVTQHFHKRIQALKLYSSSTAASNVSSRADSQKAINIPFRKERGPTDILCALEKTISRDPTAPHYKYQDDPYLIPISNRGKRNYALSKESGRKAAMWLHEEYSLLFNQSLAEPEIQAFLPKATYEKKEDVSEKLLLNVIREGSVSDALTIYNLLEQNVSVECKQALLELLCFYNCTEQLPADLVEERWYRKASVRQREMWKGGPEVEKLFECLKNEDKPIAAAAYNALICGTAKYIDVGRAWNLFEECEEKKIPLCIKSYNSIIQLVPLLRDGPGERKTLLMELLQKVRGSGLSPDTGTFNAALRVAAAINIQHISKDVIRSLFDEFKRIGIEPSLASYYFALTTFCKEHGAKSYVLREILNDLEGKTLTMQDPCDNLFFVTAMDVAKNHLNDLQLGQKIHKLLLTDDNYNFIGEGFKESIYYRHYMVLLLKNLPFAEFMKSYDLMVPNIYIPEPSVMQAIVEALELADPEVGRNVLPRLWSHMIMFEHLDREVTIIKTFNLMRTTLGPPADSPLNEQYAEAAWHYFDFVKEQRTGRYERTTWSGNVLADIAILSLRGGHFDRFLEVISTMVKAQSFTVGIASVEQLNIIFEACLEQGHSVGALEVLKYSVEAGVMESATMAQKLQANIPLSPEQKSQLSNLIGFEVPSKESASSEPTEQ